MSFLKIRSKLLAYNFIWGIIFILFSSCKKEYNQPTQAEVTATELKNVIKTNGIGRIIPWEYDSIFPNSFSSIAGTNFSFSNGFLNVNGFSYAAYNLDTIANVNVMNENGNIVKTDKALILYFY
jgi:hypothetical protein